jgi:phosphoserine phosphatase RsbU/P
MSSTIRRPAPSVRNWKSRILGGGMLDVTASELPASRLCGDISDVVQTGEDSLLIAAGDASGHGTAAGMLIVDVRRLLQMMAASRYAPGEMLGHINRHVMRRFPSSRFVTLTLVAIDLYSGAVTFASAGQPSYRIDASGQTEILDSDNAPVGIVDEEVFSTQPLDPLSDGDSLVLMSDGFREALNPAGQMYGEARLLEQLSLGQSDPALGLIDRLHADVELHKEGCEDHDDMTIVVVRAS